MKRMFRIPAWAGAILIVSAALPPTAHAMNVHELELNLSPAQPFLFQPCELELRIVLSPGTVLRSPKIEGLPDPSTLDIGPLREHPVRTERQRERTVEIRRYSARVRPLVSRNVAFTPVLRATLLERRGGLFINTWFEQPLRKKLPRVELDVLPLPARGRPEHYGQAVGRFTLSARLAPAEIDVGGLVTVRTEVTGRGWPGDTPPAFGSPPREFTIYPPRIVAKNPEGRIITEQTLVARGTNVTALPPIVFHYFDPEARQYRQATAGPLPVRVLPGSTNTVPREIALDLAPPNPPLPNIAFFTHSPLYYLKLWTRPLLLFLPFLLLSAAPWLRRRFGRFASPLLLAIGILVLLFALQKSLRSIDAREFTLTKPAELRLAPHTDALVLRPLPRGAIVEQLAAENNWLRVRFGQSIGWIQQPGRN